MKLRGPPFFTGVFLPVVVLITACSTPPPDDLGVTDGQFSPCPSWPHCVSSQAPADDDHHIDAFEFNVAGDEAWLRLQQVITALPRTQIIAAQPNYLYAEVRTPTVGFTDDLEFYLDHEADAIQVRSSSRIGYWDWGTNRNRVEEIRAALQDAGVLRR
jgi:uncharacterized protein (DUF1499 family)